jgi:4-amino-4-deoxy-L-arabinose transferase-like glycosyltransferase
MIAMPRTRLGAVLGPWSRGQLMVWIAILWLASAVRLFGLGDQSLWYDESDRIFIASLPLDQLFPAMAQETLSYLPFYFLLVKPFTTPFSEFVVRYPSVLFGVLGVVLAGQLGGRILGPPGGLAVALLLAVNPFHVWFSRDANFYVLIACAAAGSLYFFLCLLKEQTRRYWVGLALFSGVGIWTHYFYLTIPLAELLYLLITFRHHYRLLRTWTLAHVIAFVPLVPWYVFVVRRGEFHFGSPAPSPPHLEDLFYTFWNFSIGYTAKVSPVMIVSLGLFAGAMAVGIWQARKQPKLLLVLALCLPIGLTFLMALRLPMYMDRYLIGTLPAYIVLVSMGALKLSRRLRAIWLPGLILASALGTAQFFYDGECYTKEDWRGAAAYVQAGERTGDAIMPLLYQSLTPLVSLYYNGSLPFEPIVIQDVVHAPSTFADHYQRLWYIAPHPHDSTHLLARCQSFNLYAGVKDERVRQWLREHEQFVVERRDLTCISVLLYDLGAVR